MSRRFAGIRRKTEFSPNHVENDLRIINMTADALRKRGGQVAIHDEGDLNANSVNADVIFSMAQGPRGINTLKTVERRGTLILNSPIAVENCYRTNMVRLLPATHIPFPKSVIVETADGANGVPPIESRKLWIKRGDVHAIHKEDVALAYTEEEKLTIIREFHYRGIDHAVLQEHIEGDTVKFYAIRESTFFHWYYLNGANRTRFDTAHLRFLANASAEILGLYIYGGDAIIGQNGALTIIDINDWPSFAVVREQASEEIANLIFRKAMEI